MTTFDLRSVHVRSGDQHRAAVEVDVGAFLLGGQEYAPQPDPTPAALTLTRATSGVVLELDFAVTLDGPCFRCLTDTELALSLHAREYQALKPASDDERSEYVDDDRVDLSAWARDTLALSLPDKILCRPDCAGLCPVCGKDLNDEP
ncbi:MAG TPA: YceD family protein, partial [Gaiellaceae bacterium]|nr:YceD family protein [Gaiellaceae bacterium]